MRNLLIFSAIFLSIFSNSFAEDKIYTMGYLTGIVADDSEWLCEKTTDENKALGLSANQSHIKGKSKNFPITFHFFADPKASTSGYVTEFLKNYAIRTNTVFYDVKTVGAWGAKRIDEGAFFNNESSGYFQYYIEKRDGVFFVMLTKIHSELLDEHSRELLYNNTQNLITPLYKPKALSLWLESVERDR